MSLLELVNRMHARLDRTIAVLDTVLTDLKALASK